LLFFFQAEDGIRDFHVTGVQTCALPISGGRRAAYSASSFLRVANCAGVNDLTAMPTGSSGFTSGSFLVTISGGASLAKTTCALRSEERRVGKEGRSRGAPSPETTHMTAR